MSGLLLVELVSFSKGRLVQEVGRTLSQPCPPASSPAIALFTLAILESFEFLFLFLFPFSIPPPQKKKKKFRFVFRLTAGPAPKQDAGGSGVAAGAEEEPPAPSTPHSRPRRPGRWMRSASAVSLSSCVAAGCTVSSEGADGGGVAVEPGRAAMEQRPPRRSRPASRPPAKPRLSAEPQAAQLWLFPSAPGLRGALSRRSEATRQMCCSRERLAVLERGGAGVQVHQLPAGSDGAKKPSEWGRATPSRPSGLGRGCEGGRPARAGSDAGGGRVQAASPLQPAYLYHWLLLKVCFSRALLRTSGSNFVSLWRKVILFSTAISYICKQVKERVLSVALLRGRSLRRH